MTFEQYQVPLHKMLTHFCTKSIQSENRLSDYVTSVVAEQLAASYTVLDGLSVDGIGSSVVVDIPKFSIQEYRSHLDYQYLAPLLDIYAFVNDKLSSFIDGFYLHGSLATMDYIKGWSDVDTFVILSLNTVTDAKKLLQVRSIFSKIHQAMKRIDSLQHHGVILATGVDLKSYSEYILPVKVFERMKCMSGSGNKTELKVRTLPTGFDYLTRFLAFLIEAE